MDGPPKHKPNWRVIREGWQNHAFAKPTLHGGRKPPCNGLELIKEAFAAGRDDLAWSYIRSRDVEERHAALYKSAFSTLAGERKITYHVCEVCGYVFEDEPPDACPVCKSGRDKFKAIG